MYVGIPNPNALIPLEKMTIKPEGKDSFEVLYNPESYTQSRTVHYAQSSGISTNTPVSQFAGGSLETLQFRLFFDSMSAGSEVGGGSSDKAKFTANSVLPSIAKAVDVRKYTKKVYSLMEIDPDKHVPPLVKLKWSSLQFTGHLISCQQNFVRFGEQGVPCGPGWTACFRNTLRRRRRTCHGRWSRRTPQSTAPSTRGIPCGQWRPRSTVSRSSGALLPMPTDWPIPAPCVQGSGW